MYFCVSQLGSPFNAENTRAFENPSSRSHFLRRSRSIRFRPFMKGITAVCNTDSLSEPNTRWHAVECLSKGQNILRNLYMTRKYLNNLLFGEVNEWYSFILEFVNSRLVIQISFSYWLE